MTEQTVLVSPEFDAKIVRGVGCWEWVGAVDATGYGRVWQNGRYHGAHRLVYQFLYGPLPSAIYVCHKCDYRRCVRPDHLFAGTAADNNRDMWEKGRGVVSGVPLPGESNPQAVLTEHDVEVVRKLVLADVPQLVVAEAFGVSAAAVSDIIRGRRWAS